MSRESHALTEARKHLHAVEASLLSDDAERRLSEGFALLEDLTLGGSPERTVAENLGRLYASKLKLAIEDALTPRNVPEPVLRHLMRLSRALGETSFAADMQMPALTARVARRFLDSVFEGYTEAEKDAEIRRLLARMGEK